MRSSMVTLAALALMLPAGRASAEEARAVDWASKSGAYGLGASTTLGGTRGINLRTYLTPLVGLSATLGLDYSSASTSADGDDVDTTRVLSSASLYGSYKLAYWQRGHLSALFGLDVAHESVTIQTGGNEMDASGTDVSFGLGLMGEWFPTQYLSLFAQLGPRLGILGTPGSVASIDPGATGGSAVAFDLGADLFGAAGFTVWFR